MLQTNGATDAISMGFFRRGPTMKRPALWIHSMIAVVCTASTSHALPTIQVTHHFGDPFLQANQLRSATIRLVGFEDGQSIQGFIGTVQNPWNVVLGFSGGGQFFNIDSVVDPDDPKSFLFEDGFYAAPAANATLNALTAGAAKWDSGLLGNPASFGSPADGDPLETVGGFALFTDGSSDVSVDQMAWISIQPGGVPVNSSTQLPVMRLTWPIGYQNTVSFVLAMNTPNQSMPFSVSLVVADAFGACCFPNNTCGMWGWVPCESFGGKFQGNFTDCEFISCPQCFGDLAGSGQVDVHDLLALIADWGGGTVTSPADLNDDGTVNVLDLLALINAWGACP
jgi:hypothetical protein